MHVLDILRSVTYYSAIFVLGTAGMGDAVYSPDDLCPGQRNLAKLGICLLGLLRWYSPVLLILLDVTATGNQICGHICPPNSTWLELFSSEEAVYMAWVRYYIDSKLNVFPEKIVKKYPKAHNTRL